jgi:hypothetical protein
VLIKNKIVKILKKYKALGILSLSVSLSGSTGARTQGLILTRQACNFFINFSLFL